MAQIPLVTPAGAQAMVDAHSTAADPHAALEARISRTGATAGQVPALQANGSLAFATPSSGGITSQQAAGIAAGMTLVFGG